MKTTPPTRKEDVKDPVGTDRLAQRQRPRRRAHTDAVGCYDQRGLLASGTPWLPVPPTYTTVNVKAEDTDPNSLLAWYETLIQLKKTNPVLAHGANVMLDTDNTKVLSWMRQAPGSAADRRLGQLHRRSADREPDRRKQPGHKNDADPQAAACEDVAEVARRNRSRLRRPHRTGSLRRLYRPGSVS